MKKYLNYTRTFFSLLGGANWYQGIDRPTVWQYFYRWRVGLGTAHSVAKMINL